MVIDETQINTTKPAPLYRTTTEEHACSVHTLELSMNDTYRAMETRVLDGK